MPRFAKTVDSITDSMAGIQSLVETVTGVQKLLEDLNLRFEELASSHDASVQWLEMRMSSVDTKADCLIEAANRVSTPVSSLVAHADFECQAGDPIDVSEKADYSCSDVGFVSDHTQQHAAHVNLIDAHCQTTRVTTQSVLTSTDFGGPSVGTMTEISTKSIATSCDVAGQDFGCQTDDALWCEKAAVGSCSAQAHMLPRATLGDIIFEKAGDQGGADSMEIEKAAIGSCSTQVHMLSAATSGGGEKAAVGSCSNLGGNDVDGKFLFASQVYHPMHPIQEDGEDDSLEEPTPGEGSERPQDKRGQSWGSNSSNDGADSSALEFQVVFDGDIFETFEEAAKHVAKCQGSEPVDWSQAEEQKWRHYEAMNLATSIWLHTSRAGYKSRLRRLIKHQIRSAPPVMQAKIAIEILKVNSMTSQRDLLTEIAESWIWGVDQY